MSPEDYCQQKAAKSGSSFYYSFLFLPPQRRQAITALYAFCREVDDVVDDEGWPEIRSALIKSIGGNSIPIIYVDDTSKDTLILRHEHDGRDLELNYADQCVKHISKMWKGPVKLFTILEGDPFEIS